MRCEIAAPVEFYEYSSSDPLKLLQWRPSSSRGAIVDRIDSLTVITWNIWFDKLEQDTRFSSVLKELTSIPLVDVIALQEVTAAFLEMIQADTTIRRDWLLTDYRDANHRKEIVENWYGNIFLVRRKWAGAIRGWVTKFPTSKMGRFIVTLEMFQGDTSVIRIGNAHFDSPGKDVEERKRQSDLCRRFLTNKDVKGAGTLSSSTLIILCGDLNFQSTIELNNLAPRYFQDTITITSMNSAVDSQQSATIGITYPIQTHNPRRSDFVLFRGDDWECTRHVHLANNPIKDSNGDEIPCKRGRDGYLYPSDHLSILTEFKRASQDI